MIMVMMVKTINDLTMKVPSTHPPKYTIDPGVSLVPINGLARLDKSWEKYVVIGEKIIKGLKDVSLIGAGKTGIDAVLRLLDLGVDQVIFFLISLSLLSWGFSFCNDLNLFCRT